MARGWKRAPRFLLWKHGAMRGHISWGSIYYSNISNRAQLCCPLHPTTMPVAENSSCKLQAMKRHEKSFYHSGKYIQLWCGSVPSLIRGAILSPESPCLLPHSSNRKMGLVSTDPGDCSAGDVCRCLPARVHSYPLPPPTTLQCTDCHKNYSIGGIPCHQQPV